MRLFLVYVLVELAVVIALAATIGFGWTFLLLLGTFVLGLALAGSQAKRQLRRLQTGLISPQGAVTDGALVALGSVLTVVPGLVTSVLGLLLLLPPTRAVAAPMVAVVAARHLVRVPLVVPGGSRSYQRAGGEYVEGEVIDVTDVEAPRLPRRPD